MVHTVKYLHQNRQLHLDRDQLARVVRAVKEHRRLPVLLPLWPLLERDQLDEAAL